MTRNERVLYPVLAIVFALGVALPDFPVFPLAFILGAAGYIGWSMVTQAPSKEVSRTWKS